MDRLQKALKLARAERDSKLLPGPPTSADLAAVAKLRNVTVAPSARMMRTELSVLHANRVMPAEPGGPAGHAFKMLRTQVLQRLRQQRLEYACCGQSHPA